MKYFDSILKTFEVEKRVIENAVCINISSQGMEYVSLDKHEIRGNIENIYFNDFIKNLEVSYIFDSMLNALSYFSMFPQLLKQKILLIITGNSPSFQFLSTINRMTEHIYKFYFCINNTIDSKLFNTSLFIRIGGSDNISTYQANINEWIFIYDDKSTSLFLSNLQGVARFKKALLKFNLQRTIFFDVLAPQRKYNEFKNLYNY